MKFISIVFILFLNYINCFSQSTIEFSGQIVDKNHESIISAHLVVEGTSIGTLSNDDGFFSLKIPKSNCSQNIRISHVGFKTLVYNPMCKNSSDLTLQLIESTTQLDSLNIGDISAKQVVRNAIENLERNHEVEAVSYETYIRLAETVGGNPSTLRELIVDAYHEENSKADIKIIKARGKGFTKFGKERLKKATMVNVYALHSHLLLRYLPDFLEKGKINKYDFQFLNDVEVDGQKYYAISVDSDRYLKGGEIWIHPATFAIKYLKKTYQDEYWKKESKINTIYESYYTESEGKWYLNYGVKSYDWIVNKENIKISRKNTYFVVDRKTSKDFTRKEEMGLMVKPFKLFQGKFDDDFWDDYNYIQLEEKLKK
ncbi:MAG: hypothetical protein ACI85I_000403 [Arenicella sp.]|jgi:hypothetical protein